MKTWQLRISGKVQGVWYRASAKDKAMQLGLKGKVWNESNGDVGADIQGEETDVQAFIAWCWQGPSLAKVENVQVHHFHTEEKFSSFEIVSGRITNNE